MKAGHIWQRWDIYCMLEERSEHENFLLITNKKQNGTFLHSETFLPTDWQYIWKRKANAYHTPWSKSTDAIFWQLQDPGMHYIADFGSVILTYLPQDQYKKVFFFFFLHSVHYNRFKLCSLHFFSAVYILTSYTVYSSPSDQAAS